MRFVVAIPVHNEEEYIESVLDCAGRFSEDIVVIDDGSTDGSAEKARRAGAEVVSHRTNHGYGRALRTAFSYAAENDYDVVITMDADKQHPPRFIPVFLYHMADYDVVSGSRYLEENPDDTPTLPNRARINGIITRAVNQVTGYGLTDSFCGYKACRVKALEKLDLREDGYAMPLEFWLQAAARGLTVKEIPVSLIYLDPSRSFGGSLDDDRRRLAYYNEVLRREARQAGLATPRIPTVDSHEAEDALQRTPRE